VTEILAWDISGQATLVLWVLGVAPGLCWLWYFLSKDIRPEPMGLIGWCFLAGAIAAIVAYFMEVSLRSHPFVDSVFMAPVVEECLKFLAVCFLVYWRSEFDEPMDGVVYAVAAALGFASLENVIYLFYSFRASFLELSFIVIVRAFLSVPAHALFAAIWGYGLGRAKFSDERTARGWIIKGLVTAVLFHVLFNLVAQVDFLWAAGMIILIPVMWGAVNRTIVIAALRSPHRSDKTFRQRSRELRGDLLVTRVLHAKWYDNKAVTLLLLFLVFFPAGLYGLWKNRTFSRPEKVCILALWGSLVSMLLWSIF